MKALGGTPLSVEGNFDGKSESENSARFQNRAHLPLFSRPSAETYIKADRAETLPNVNLRNAPTGTNRMTGRE